MAASLVAGISGMSHHAYLSVRVLVSNTGQMSPIQPGVKHVRELPGSFGSVSFFSFLSFRPFGELGSSAVLSLCRGWFSVGLGAALLCL